jgi:site-specific DNA recombinase
LVGAALAGELTGGRAFGYVLARDSGTSKIEIDEVEAVTVRRIFTLCADGMSLRTIAAALNAEGVPSPGARRKRSERRKDHKWLASAVHGDINRGTGILSNRRYTGAITWGRRNGDDPNVAGNSMVAGERFGELLSVDLR